MATITPAQGELQIRTLQRSPLSRVRGNLGGLWGRPITQAIAKALLTIFVTSTITFILIRLMPGSPVEIKIDELMQQSQISYAVFCLKKKTHPSLAITPSLLPRQHSRRAIA